MRLQRLHFIVHRENLQTRAQRDLRDEAQGYKYYVLRRPALAPQSSV